MSDERWIKVTLKDAEESPDRRYFVTSRYDAAEGQRVEEIHWCENHGIPAVHVPGEGDYCFLGKAPHSCHVVDATLILPPRAEP